MSALQPGDIISSGRTLYRHVGMVHGWNGWGEVLVIDNSPETGGVAIRTLQAFLGGSDLRVERRAHPSDAYVWLQRARARLGQGYDLLLYNCEHFVYEVTEGTPWSPQLQLRVGIVGLLGVATVGYLLLRSPSRSRAA